MPTSVKRNNVAVTGGVFKERMTLNRNYLLELDTDSLLQNFYLEAGIILPNGARIHEPESANIHWGWESPTCQLRGHFLGHWMSAAARLSSDGTDNALGEKLKTIVAELERCQKRNGGEWTGPIPEKYLDLMAKDEYIWSPQYTMHKTIMGLVDTYKYTGNEQALGIVDKLADWFIRWAECMRKTDPQITYKGEQAGMLEMWAELYALTKDDKYLLLIDLYKNNALFRRLEDTDDGLTDDHANASIPLSHGAARMYEVTGDEYWRRMTDLFWERAVTKRGMFATTGSNAGEFWIPLGSHGRYLCDTDQEFCTVYNMVRTADYMYRRTGDTKYADYIERALYNGFLAQQNRRSGMPSYFLPLRAGGHKAWGTKTRDFWCCHGTMIQAQTLYSELIYYTVSDGISVMQYIPSRARFDINGSEVIVSQSTEMKNYDNQVLFDDHSGGGKSRWSLKFSVTSTTAKSFVLRLRVPSWSRGVLRFTVNGENAVPEIKDGCICLDRTWSDDTVYVTFESGITMERLSDEPWLAAAVDGPIVLAGLTDKDCGLVGDFDEPDRIFVPREEHTYITYVWKQNNYVTKGQPVNIEFIPLYDVTDEPYTVYFTEKKAQ